jgi:hypothetical protein
MHVQHQRGKSTSTSGSDGSISGMIKTRAPGRPIAEPRPGIVIVLLRNNPPIRNTAKKQIRSHGRSTQISRARSAAAMPSVAPNQPRTVAMRVPAVSSTVTRYMTIITIIACGMRCVKTGTVAIMQARVSRRVAAPRPGVGASSRRKKSKSAERFIHLPHEKWLLWLLLPKPRGGKSYRDFPP